MIGKMRKSKITKSLFLGNVGISIGLFIMFAFITIGAYIGLVLPKSVQGGINVFFTDYNLADAWVYTSMLTEEDVENAVKSNVIKEIQCDTTVETKMVLKNGDSYNVRVVGVEDGFQKFYEYSNDGNGDIAITVKFANYNGIKTGDEVYVKTTNGFKEIDINKIVTTPEFVVSLRDEYSWNDATDFGCIYMPKQTFNRYYGDLGYCNKISILFTENSTSVERKQAVDDIVNALRDKAYSSLIFEESQLKRFLQSELEAYNKSIDYFHLIILAVGICFSTLFVTQVMEKERKTIGLLRALGYSKMQILTAFAKYVERIIILALLFGVVVGEILIGYVFGVCENLYSIPEISFRINIPRAIIELIILFAVGFISCLVSVDKITEISPSEAYGGWDIKPSKPPKIVSKLRLSLFTKISLTSTLRNKRRLLQSVICLSVCIIMTVMSISMLASKNKAIPMNFGERFRYDGIVRINNEQSFNEIEKVEGVSKAEPIVLFSGEITLDGKSEFSQINAITSESKLVVLKDGKGKEIKPVDDGILLEEYFAKIIGAKTGDIIKLNGIELSVTGIVREYIRSIQYVTPSTAEKLGFSEVNCVAVTVENGYEVDKVFNVIERVTGYTYYSKLSSQKTSVTQAFKALNVIFIIYCTVALLLGLILVYNLVLIDASEKKRAFVTLITLGASNREFGIISFVDNAIKYFLAVIISCPLGLYSSSKIRFAMSTIGHSYPPVHVWLSFAVSCLLSTIYVVIGVLTSIKHIKKINAVYVNTRE